MRSIQWQIQHHESLDSTNTQAATLIQKLWNQDQPAHAHFIVADRQSAGRGQHGRSWESPAGGLYLSIILEEIPIALRDKLALFAGVAVARALVQLNITQVGLRWPNDITLGAGADKKVAGILCESLAQGTRYAAILGIGINVNSNLSDLSPALRPHATSLAAHTGNPLDKLLLIDHILSQIPQLLDEIQDHGLAALIARARGFDSLKGKSIECIDGPRTLTGIANGIGDSGQLLLLTASGPVELTTATLTSLNGQRLRSQS